MALFRYKRIWGALLLPGSLLLVSLASAYPGWTERLYSTRIYPLLAGTFGRIAAMVPWSLAQWLVILGPLLLLLYIVRQIRAIVKTPAKRGDRILRLASTLLCIAGVGYFAFVALCGLNYHREPFATVSGLPVRPSSAQELRLLSEDLAQRANGLRDELDEDAEGVMALSDGDMRALAVQVQNAYQAVAGEYETLSGYTAKPKPVLFSKAMSYLDITGVYTFFTFEPNVNVDAPHFWIPSTMAHELAHFKGYMREDEANFIAYLVCSASGNRELDYSGVILALVHSSNALYSADKDQYWAVMETLSPGVKRDLAANSAYWQSFEGPVAEVSSRVNDAYLKSNRQESGVKSYGRMVDLLLAEYRLRHGL